MSRIALVSFALVLTSCGTAEKDRSGVDIPLGLFSKPENTRTLTPDGVKLAINKTRAFYLNESKKTEGGSADQTLIKCLLNDIKAEADGDSLFINGDMTKGYCFSQAWGDAFAPKASTSVAFHIRCSGADFKDLNGKQVRHIRGFFAWEFDGICDGEVEVIGTIKSHVTMEGTVLDDKHEIEFTSNYAIATSTASPTFCTFKREDSTVYDNTCTQVTQTKIEKYTVNGLSNPEKIGFDYHKLRSVGLEGNDDGTSPFYNKGRYDITFNNWEGTMTYSDAMTRPSYVVKNAEQQTVDGLFVGQPD